MCLLCFYRFSELLEAVLGDILLNRPKRPPEARKSDKNTANTKQVRFFELYFDFNVFSAENRRLFSIEFQLHTNSHIMQQQQQQQALFA